MRTHERIIITYTEHNLEDKSSRQIPLVVFEHTKHDHWVSTLTGFARDNVPGAHGTGLGDELTKAIDELHSRIHNIRFED